MANFFKHTSAASVLNSEFDRRKHTNVAYSLRAFARDLNLSPSRLSELLSGKFGLSEKTAVLIAHKLNLGNEEKNYFLDLVLSQSARSPKIKKLAFARLSALRSATKTVDLKDDEFQVIADWYHGAILELTQLKDFKGDVTWISNRLGITEDQAKMAIERLIKLNLLEIKRNQWIVKPEAYSAFSNTPSMAIRKFLRQILNGSIESLLNDATCEREVQAMILAVPRSKLPEFRGKIKNFLLDIWKDLDTNEAKDSLYSISIQVTPIKNRRKLNC